MINYELAFWLLIAFFLGYCFDRWLDWQQHRMICPTCKGEGYINKKKVKE